MPRYLGKALVGALMSGRSAAIRVVPRCLNRPRSFVLLFFFFQNGDLRKSD